MNSETAGTNNKEIPAGGAEHSQSAPPSTRKDFVDYAVGDSIQGEQIDFIYYATPRYLIYETRSALRYKLQKDPANTSILAEIKQCAIDAETQLRGTCKKDLKPLLARCLDSALRALDGKPAHFDPIRSFIRERGPIQYVYGVSSEFIVYLSKEGLVAYDYDALPTRLIPAATEFHRLQHIASSSLQKSDQEVVRSILGTDLVSAFRLSEQVEPSNLFLSSREFITNRSEALLRSEYVRSSVISSALFLIALLPMAYYLKARTISAWPILLGAAGGVVGSAISIIQRGVGLKVDPFVPTRHVVFQGTVRIILGVTFGSLLVVASNAGIALGILAGNVWSLFIFSVVAGFSERFIPDILDRIAVEKHGRLRHRKRKEEQKP